jgi:glycine hydroxymethyltransferase
MDEKTAPGHVGPRSAGDLLRLARRLADLSQRQLAEVAGTSPRVVSRIESGETSAPRLVTVQKLLSAAGFELVLKPRAASGHEDVGVEDDGVRDVPEDGFAEVTDRAGRRFPAHLDVRPVDEFGSWWGDWGMLSTRFPVIWHLAPRQRPEHTFDRLRWRRDQRREAQREALRDTSREASGYARRTPSRTRDEEQPMTHDPDLRTADAEVADLVVAEGERQRDSVRLIASENYVSRAVLEATGTMLTNKYSEGYAGKRYYEGQQVIDQVETLAVERAKALFGVEHANVQPYSGSPANLAVYLAFLDPGDTVMGMALPAGGHLTHGWSVSATGKWFRPVQYGVRKETGRVDMDEVRDLARAERPKIIFCGGTAIPRTIDFPAFAEIAREAGAVLVADIAHIAGLVAGGAHPSPVGHADVISTTTHKTLRGPRGAMLMSTAEHAKALDKAVFPGLQGGPHNHTTAAIAVALKEASTQEFRAYARAVVDNAKALADGLSSRGFDLVSGGTDNHLLLVDLTDKQLPGKQAAKALDRAGIELNYNTVPFDPRKPFDPSGIRIGTAAVTSRGMTTADMDAIAGWIDAVVEAERAGDAAAVEKAGAEVREFTRRFPTPGLPG